MIFLALAAEHELICSFLYLLFSIKHNKAMMLKKIGSALIGFFLFPLAEIFSKLVRTILLLGVIVLFPFVSLFLCIKMMKRIWPEANLLTVLGVSLVITLIATAITYAYILFSLTIDLLIFPFTILKGFWNGVITGWNEGLLVVLNNTFNTMIGLFLENVRPIIDIIVDRDRLLPMIIANLENSREAFDIRDPHLPEEAAEQIFNDLRLENFENHSASLTQDERVRLKGDLSKAWEAYQNLDYLNRSDTANENDPPGSPGMCCISLAYPELRKTMLLFKQYQEQEGGIWKPVPNIATIFDEDSFKTLIKGNFQNPTTRDDILNPLYYNGHITRYRIHPYYRADGKPLSQARHELTLVLRQHLNDLAIATPTAAQAAADGQHFPSPLDSRVEQEAKRRKTTQFSRRPISIWCVKLILLVVTYPFSLDGGT